MVEDIAARRRALTDDIAAKSARLMELSQQAGAQGHQLADVLAEQTPSEEDTAESEQDSEGTAEQHLTGPKPDPAQGYRGQPARPESIQEQLAAKSRVLLEQSRQMRGA